MPVYDGIGLISEKHAVILDIGNAYTKCGFAGETGPRCIIPTEVIDKKTKNARRICECEKVEDLHKVLSDFIHMLYFKHLLVNPKDRRVLIVESVLSTTVFRETLAKLLFTNFEVSSVLFVPSHLMALFTLGISTALVLDVGYEEALAIPVCEGVCMVNTAHSVPFAGKAIHKNLEHLILNQCKIRKDKSEPEPVKNVMDFIPEGTLEDLKVRACFVTSLQRVKLLREALITGQKDKIPSPPHGLDYPMDGNNVLIVPGKVREQTTEVLFERDNEEVSIATTILDCIVKCPIDMRKVMAENIVLMGGTSMLRGFKHRLITELKDLVMTDPKYTSLAVKTFKFHHPPAKENYVAWLGAAIFGATDAITNRSLTKEQYQQQGKLPDWPNLDQRFSTEKGL